MQKISGWQFFKDVIKFRFSKPKYKGKVFVIAGKKRVVIGEDCYNCFFAGLTQPIPKAYLLTISFKKQ
jgi:hypothetical protein